MRPLSVIITTHNEEPNIGRALDSVAFANDVLVVDSFSTDRTVELARARGARVVQRAYSGPADQKNWAIPQALHPWVLLLDADEAATPALAAEIELLLAAESIPNDVYWIHRTNYFWGRRIRYSGWQNDRVVRFFHRDKARYRQVQVHEEIETAGLRVGTLREQLLHYTYRDLNHFIAKVDRYARWSAQDYATRTGRITLYHLWVKPAFRFLQHYIFKQGFRDGHAGFLISKISAWMVFLRYAYLRQMRHHED